MTQKASDTIMPVLKGTRYRSRLWINRGQYIEIGDYRVSGTRFSDSDDSSYTREGIEAFLSHIDDLAAIVRAKMLERERKMKSDLQPIPGSKL